VTPKYVIATGVVMVGAIVALSACGGSSSSASTGTTGASSAAASTATTGSTATSASSSGGAMTASACPSDASVSAALGGTFTLKKTLTPDTSSIACTYTASTGGGAQIDYSVAPSGSEAMVRTRLRALAGGLGSTGGKPLSGVGDAAYSGTTTIGTGVVDASAVYTIKGLETLLIVASAPLPKVKAYAATLLG
jgi:hypothetical protein